MQDLISKHSAACRVVATASVGMSFQVKGEEVWLTKRFKVYSTSPGVLATLSGLGAPADGIVRKYVVCRGALGKLSANYSADMARLIWRGIEADVGASGEIRLRMLPCTVS